MLARFNMTFPKRLFKSIPKDALGMKEILGYIQKAVDADFFPTDCEMPLTFLVGSYPGLPGCFPYTLFTCFCLFF